MSDKKVVILGCGPAGLFSAQAALLCGLEPVIISQKKPSVLYGAQYLHSAIPGLMDGVEEFVVKTSRYGVPERYAKRVYGDASRTTSWSRAQKEQRAWSLRDVYQRAWAKFEPFIMDQPIDGPTVEELSQYFDLVISTIPAWSICMTGRHKFPSLPIMVKQSVDFQLHPEVKDADNWVIYNGTIEGLWYRVSKINGHASTEAVAHPALNSMEPGEWSLGFKILDTDCDCHPAVWKVGRMGMWKSGVLTHHAFEGTLEAISDRFGIVVEQAD